MDMANHEDIFFRYQSSISTSLSSFSSPSFTRSNFITPMQSGTLSIVMYLVTLSPQNSVITVCPVTPSTFAVDFKFRIGERFDEVTPDKREVSSIVTVDGNKFIHKSTAKVEGVTGHTVITEFCGDKVTR